MFKLNGIQIIQIIFLIQVFFSSTYCFVNVRTINITFGKNYIFGKDFFYNETTLLPSSQTILSIQYDFDWEIYKNLGFGTIQAHSFLYDVSLSQEKSIGNGINGTNLGFIVFPENSSILYVSNFNNVEVKAAIIGILYEKNAPIPGGCNTKSISPYLNVHYTDDIIKVDTSRAAKNEYDINNKSLCDQNKFEYTPHYFYLTKNDPKPETYFNGIKKMIEITQIKRLGFNARLINSNDDIVFSMIATPGTGIVFNTVVTDSDGRAVPYVPAVSYSCNLKYWHDCQIFANTSLGITVSSLLIITGFIKTFLICERLEIELFFNCLPLWAYVGYVILSHFPDMSHKTKTIIIVVLSIVLAIITCVVAHLTNLDKILALVTNLLFGLVFAVFTMFYLSQIANFTQSGALYWSFFWTIVIMFMIIIIPVFRLVALGLSFFLGVLTIIFGIQIHLQSHMLMVPLTHFRRITNPDYGYANGIWIPNVADYIVFGLAFAIIVLGIAYRKRKAVLHMDETPSNSVSINERAPLITRWTNGSDEVFETPNANYRFFRKLSHNRKKKPRSAKFYYQSNHNLI